MTDNSQVPPDAPAAGQSPARDVTGILRVVVARMQLYADSVGHELGLHRSDLMALNLMSQASQRGHSMTPSEVAKKMSLSAAAVTALVDRLENVGHLVRLPDTHDRRRVRLKVSQRAEAVSRTMFRPMNARLYTALSRYTDEELDIVARVLTDLANAIERADPEEVSRVASAPSTRSTPPRPQ